MKPTPIANTIVRHKGKDYDSHIKIFFEADLFYISASHVARRTGAVFNVRVETFRDQNDAAARYADAIQALIFESGVF